MVDVPCQENCPKVRLRKYPLVEEGPLVWIWMGDPEAADSSEIPDTSWLERDQGWEFCTGAYRLEGNYLLMMENLMDLTHIPFLHRDTFNFPPSYARMPVKVETDGDQMEYLRHPTAHYHRSGFLPDDMAADFDDRPYAARSGGRFVSPGMMYGIGEFRLTDPEPGERTEYVTRIPHFLTPETQSTTHYWFFHTRNFAQADKDFTGVLETMIRKGFDEDRAAIKHLQDLHDRDHHDGQEIHFAPDTPTITMRRIVKRLADRAAAGRMPESAEPARAFA